MDDPTLTRLICTALGGIDEWAYNGNAENYPADAVGVFYGTILKAPDRGAGVRIYGGTDDRAEHLLWRRVQVRYRGAPYRPDGADLLAEAAKPTLLAMSALPGISDVSRQSMAPMGVDGNGREMRADNYIFILDNPEASS